MGLLWGDYFCNTPIGNCQYYTNISLAFETVAKLPGFIQYNQPGRTKEDEPCEK